MKETYYYEGPVYAFDHMVNSKWSGYTQATSPAKAKSNLEYRYKMQTGRLPSAKISLGKNPEIVLEEARE